MKTNPRTVQEILDGVKPDLCSMGSFESMNRLPKSEPARTNKLKKIKQEAEQKLAERIARYEDFLRLGAHALSIHDIKLFGEEEGLRTAFLLIPNQIENYSYDIVHSLILLNPEPQKGELEQGTLF